MRACGCQRGVARPQHAGATALRAVKAPAVARSRGTARVLATAAPARPDVRQDVLVGETAQQIIDDEHKFILQTYGRPDVVFTHGQGSWLWDAEGRQFLDFTAGIAVNALGHSDARWQEALTHQAALLAHTSNLYHTVPQVQLARRLVASSFADRVFYANSGTEANEAAIKFARKYAKVQAGVDPYDAAASAGAPSEIISFTGSFHGRTMGALALTYKDQYRTPFAPVMPGAVMAPYRDAEAAAAAIQKGKTAAVFIEPIQGEGGINPAGAEFLATLRTLCDEAGALLVFDEVQVGLGRTGKLWGHEHYGVEPDMMTLAKPLAGGLPIGCVLMREKVAAVMKPGDHGSTFAGNPLACHVACTTFDIISDSAFLADVERKGELLRAGLRAGLGDNAHVQEVRGVGLIVGIQLDQMAGKMVDAAREQGLLIITAGKGDIVRLVPPLTVTDDEIDTCCRILADVVKVLA